MKTPTIVLREEWRAERKALLVREKALLRERDALNALRRRLPMVRVETEYVFEGGEGKRTFDALFEGRRQLIVYHFMFDPADPPAGRAEPWSEGCSGCSHIVDNLPHLAHLHARDTSLVLVSRAPMAKIEPFRKRMGWSVPWYSSFGTAFNYDYHVTLDPEHGSAEWNYESADVLVERGKIGSTRGEYPGISVFIRTGEGIFHTYSAYARGLDPLLNTDNLLDLTPFGRQEEWEDSPEGWPQSPTHGWLRHHDKYEAASSGSCCGSRDTLPSLSCKLT